MHLSVYLSSLIFLRQKNELNKHQAVPPVQPTEQEGTMLEGTPWHQWSMIIHGVGGPVFAHINPHWYVCILYHTLQVFVKLQFSETVMNLTSSYFELELPTHQSVLPVECFAAATAAAAVALPVEIENPEVHVCVCVYVLCTWKYIYIYIITCIMYIYHVYHVYHVYIMRKLCIIKYDSHPWQHSNGNIFSYHERRWNIQPAEVLNAELPWGAIDCALELPELFMAKLAALMGKKMGKKHL